MAKRPNHYHVVFLKILKKYIKIMTKRPNHYHVVFF